MNKADLSAFQGETIRPNNYRCFGHSLRYIISWPAMPHWAHKCLPGQAPAGCYRRPDMYGFSHLVIYIWNVSCPAPKYSKIFCGGQPGLL